MTAKQKKNRGGRPPKPDDQKRTVPIQFKVTGTERAKVNKLMAADGFDPNIDGSLSAWIRECIGLAA